jgi:hypothetical protein
LAIASLTGHLSDRRSASAGRRIISDQIEPDVGGYGEKDGYEAAVGVAIEAGKLACFTDATPDSEDVGCPGGLERGAPVRVVWVVEREIAVAPFQTEDCAEVAKQIEARSERQSSGIGGGSSIEGVASRTAFRAIVASCKASSLAFPTPLTSAIAPTLSFRSKVTLVLNPYMPPECQVQVTSSLRSAHQPRPQALVHASSWR